MTASMNKGIYTGDDNMEKIKKTAWVDTDERIIAFHVIPNATIFREVENDFWKTIVEMTRAGYRVM